MGRCVLTSLLVMSCSTKTYFETHQALGAAKVRVAALESRKAELLEKQRQLRETVTTLRAQADAIDTSRRTVVAASEVLAGRPVPLEFQLHQALVSRADATALANEVLKPLICDEFAAGPPPEEPPLPTMPDEECAPPPLADACEGVPATVTPALEFWCDRVIAHGPARAVVCQALGSNGLPPNVVRVAFLHQGRIVAADWPSNAHDLSRSENVDGLAQCRAENEHSACVRACDVRFDLVPSGCEPFHMSGHPDDGSGAADDEAPPEDPAVVAAREALQAAEEEAQRAAQARDEAARELAYRECTAACASAPPAVAEKPPPLVIGFPAPGYFVLSPDSDAGVESTVVGASQWLRDQPATQVVETLDTIARLSEVTVLSGEAAPVLGGLEAGQPTAFRLSATGADRLEAPAACALIAKGKNAALKAACARGAR
jgi:hypothetical protein